MLWVGIDIALAVIGLAVLAALTWRLWTQVRWLHREVGAAMTRLSVASDQLSIRSAQRTPGHRLSDEPDEPDAGLTRT